jgi:hypothetical protein
MSLRLSLLTWAGRILNLAGVPGYVRAGNHQSEFGSVQVRVSPLYTVITVNGVDVFFYRLTGGIDGVGVSQTSNYTMAAPRSAVAVADPAPSE